MIKLFSHVEKIVQYQTNFPRTAVFKMGTYTLETPADFARLNKQSYSKGTLFHIVKFYNTNVYCLAECILLRHHVKCSILPPYMNYSHFQVRKADLHTRISQSTIAPGFKMVCAEANQDFEKMEAYK